MSEGSSGHPKKGKSFFQNIKYIFFSRKMLSAFLMGFSCGLPLALTGNTLKAWMTDVNVDITVIGLFALVGLPYSLKPLWSPILDYYVPPFLGRRRGWLLIAQVALAISIAMIGFSNPEQNLTFVCILAIATAFFSATQDIIVDSYRREVLTDEELGLGSSLYVNGYLLAMRWISGGIAIAMADYVPWSMVYFSMAGLMVIGIGTTLFSREPEIYSPPPKHIKDAVIEPLKDFFNRSGALYIMAFIVLYKLGDTLAGELIITFILNQGFTKTEYFAIAKGLGLGSMIAGTLTGGVLLVAMGIFRGLWIFGIIQAVAILSFAVLANMGANVPVLAAAIAIDNFAAGLGTSAFSAYLASLTNKKYTATQFALLTSLMAIPRVVLSSPSGYLVKYLGWTGFFIFCTISAIPGLLLLLKIIPLSKRSVGDTVHT